MIYDLKLFKFSDHFAEPPQNILDVKELSDYRHISDKGRQREFLQSRYHVKEYLNALLGIPLPQIEFEKYGMGKIRCPQYTGDLNWSHSGDYLTAVFSDSAQVGVDLEFIHFKDSYLSLGKKILTVSEQDLLFAHSLADQHKLFWHFWTGKEALIKANASGGFKDAHNIEIDPLAQKVLQVPQGWGEPHSWNLSWDEPVENYLRAVAWRQSPWQIRKKLHSAQ